MSQQESHTAILVAAEQLLRVVDYPACRGLPTVTVPTTLLGQLAGACQIVVNAEADEPSRELQGADEEDHSGRCADRGCWCWTDVIPLGPQSHQEGQSAAPGADMHSDSYCGPCPTCADLQAQLAELRGDRPGFCSADPTCWMAPMVPGGTCYRHSEIAQKPHPFENMRMRDRMFRDVADQDG